MMEEAVFEALWRHTMLQKGDNVIVALSGGADSVALFHFLAQHKEELGITLSAAHFEHGLRGEASLRDMEYVEQLCGEWGVALCIGHGEMDVRARPRGVGTEAFARQLRYAFLEELAQKQRAKVALAHTRSDNAETVLFHAIRGSGPRGLSGIPPVRGCFVRPLLLVSRRQVEEYCHTHRLAYVQDDTNQDPQYSRNLLRLRAMPLLEQAHGGAADNLARMAGDMRALDDWLYAQALALLECAVGTGEADESTGKNAHNGICTDAPDNKNTRENREEDKRAALLPPEALLAAARRGCRADALLAAPAPVLLKALALLAGPKADRAALSRMQQVLAGHLGGTQLPGGAAAMLQQGRLVVQPPQGAPAQTTVEYPFAEGEFFFPGGYALRVRMLESPPKGADVKKTAQKGLTFVADCDKIINCSVLRTRREKDSFSPAGRGVTKTLKKWMNEQKIPTLQRGLLPLLAVQSQVLWVWGGGFCQAVLPDDATRRWLVIEEIRYGEGPPDGNNGTFAE